MWQELFSPDSELSGVLWGTSKILPSSFDVEALSKLLMYGNYAKAKAEAQVTPVANIIMKELEHYPYARKTNIVAPYFTPTDIKRTYPFVSFRAGITDAGIIDQIESYALLRSMAMTCPF